MTTLIPPLPKRQRKNPTITTTSSNGVASSIVCQFRNAKDGTLLGPSVSLPADTGREGLELLVNNLRGSVSSLFFLSLFLLNEKGKTDYSLSLSNDRYFE